jgi:alpha/beta superfamily hydrolase
VTEKYVTFSGDGLELEGILHLPQGKPPFPAVAMCHPHPLYGGNMHNNVVIAICQALARVFIACLRFNFRGVGRSEGNFSSGIGEQEDVKAALTFLSTASEVNPDRIGLAGYSFGTMVALPVALRSNKVRAVALVSPILSTSDWEQLKNYVNPKLLLIGSEDYFVSFPEKELRPGQFPEPKQYEVISGADHFWFGYEEEVSDKVSNFFATVF